MIVSQNRLAAKVSGMNRSVATAVYNIIGEQLVPAEMTLDFLLVPNDGDATDPESPIDPYDLNALAAGEFNDMICSLAFTM